MTKSTLKNKGDELLSIMQKVLLITTPLVTGAAIMMIELLGTRIISPYFGVSLYVWTSLITVTLIALTAGYWWGGYIADKKKSADFLYFLIFLAGFFLLFIPILQRSFLTISSHLGLRLGSLVSSFLLFFIPIFLLGAVAPYLVKLYAHDLTHIGQIVGHLYAISSAGSFLGTILTGFLFIPYFQNESILLFISFVLMTISLIYWLLFLKKGRLMICFITLLGMLGLYTLWQLLPKPAREQVIGPNRFHLVDKKNSIYGQIKVIDVNSRFRALVLDGLLQNAVDLSSQLSIYEYTYALQMIARSYQPKGQKALVIGLGAGTIPSELRRDNLEVDCVEINPMIVNIAEQYFGFQADGITLFIQDARYFVRSCSKKYDLIFLDAFNGDSVPEHLLTQEMFLDLEKIMNPGGVLCLNFFGSLAEGYSFGTYSLAKTLNHVFRQVDTFASLPPDKIGGNIYFLATNEKLNPDQLMVIDLHYCFYPIYNQLCTLSDHKIELDDQTGIILSDAYNPIVFFDACTREAIRKRMLTSMGQLLL